MPKVPKQHIKKAFAKDHRNLKLTDGAVTAVSEGIPRITIRSTWIICYF